MDVLLHEGEKERVLIREDNLSHAFTACIVVSDRTMQPVIKLNELNKPDRHRMLDKLRNDCDTASDYPYLFVKSAVQLFFLFIGAKMCPPGDGIEGFFWASLQPLVSAMLCLPHGDVFIRQSMHMPQKPYGPL